jgi:cytochrome c-type biogenesis protein CcsB
MGTETSAPRMKSRGLGRVRSSSIGSGGYRQGVMAASTAGGPGPALSLQSAAMGVSEQLDSLSYRTITVGFLLLSVGIVSGAVWANEAWGSWWSWDPKETWALICWLVYAAYLHTRLSRGWQGRRPALVAVAGLVVICVCYIGVNLLGIGLHSYGFTDSGFMALASFIVSQLAFIAL